MLNLLYINQGRYINSPYFFHTTCKISKTNADLQNIKILFFFHKQLSLSVDVPRSSVLLDLHLGALPAIDPVAILIDSKKCLVFLFVHQFN